MTIGESHLERSDPVGSSTRCWWSCAEPCARRRSCRCLPQLLRYSEITPSGTWLVGEPLEVLHMGQNTWPLKWQTFYFDWKLLIVKTHRFQEWMILIHSHISSFKQLVPQCRSATDRRKTAAMWLTATACHGSRNWGSDTWRADEQKAAHKLRAAVMNHPRVE